MQRFFYLLVKRDIKGSNVLLKRDSSVVLADFGTAIFEETEKVEPSSSSNDQVPVEFV